MAIPVFTPKAWKDSPDQSTPLSADALKDLETRVASYAVAVANTIPVGPPGASGLPDGFLNFSTDFGGVVDGVTDDTNAWVAALLELKTNGGTLLVPRGTSIVESMDALVVDTNLKMWTILGASKGMQFQQGSTRVRFKGSGSGNGLQIVKSSAWEIAGITFEYDNEAFTGHLINIDGTGADCQDWHIHHSATRDLTVARGAASMLRTHKVVIASIDHCHFSGGQQGIRVGDPGGAYVNVLQIEKCTFNSMQDAQVMVGSADCESLTIRDCTFEAGTNTTAIRGSTAAVDGGQNQCYTPVIENNWFGDSAGGQKWIDNLSVQSNSYVGTIKGNRFASVGGGGTHLTLRGKWLIEGNSFESGTAIDSPTASSFGAILIGNDFNVTTLFNATSFPNGVPDTYRAIGNIPLSLCPDYNQDQVAIFGTQSALVTSGRGTLILGTQANAGYAVPPTNSKGLVYTGKIPGTTRPMLAVAAPWNGSTSDGALVSGPTPEAMVWWQNKALGFFGGTPVALPASTGTATGFTAGAGTAVNDQSTFTGGVGMPAPSGFSVTAVATGGTFAAGTYFWQITATNAAGETVGSTERSAAIVLNGSATLTWSRVPGATGYKVYRATATGGEATTPALVTTIGSGDTVTYTDTGTAVGAGAVPAASTALTAYRINDIVKALKQLTLLAP